MKQFEWTDELVHEYQIFQFTWYQKNVTNEDIGSDKNLAQKCMDAFKQFKQPLFTTEDGVPVYEGQQYWYVDDVWYIDCLKAFDNTCALNCKAFSTRAAAEKYVLENKPQLSLSDVERAYVGDKKSKEYISLIDNLKLIIKQKQ